MYHESLALPAMLHHPRPRRVFICGGGEGATAREVLRHRDVEEVVMADVDEARAIIRFLFLSIQRMARLRPTVQVVCDFCERYMEANKEAFKDDRLKLVIGDAKEELERDSGTFDVIVGDLADPIEGGPCYWLYTQNFYEKVVRKKLKEGGIFVTQSGPGGFLTHRQVFTPINRTVREVFPKVVPYHAHVPSFADTWSWNMAFTSPTQRILTAEEMDEQARAKLRGESQFLDGTTFHALASLNKLIKTSIAQEDTILTEENPRFIPGTGLGKGP